MSRIIAALAMLMAVVLPAQEEPALMQKSVYATPRELAGASKTPGILKRILFGDKGGEDLWVRPMSAASSDDFRFVCDSGTPAFWVISRAGKKAFKAAPPGGWKGPVDLAVGGGFCYVSDADAGAVWSYEIRTRAWTRVPGEFHRPTGLGWAASRSALLIVDTEAQILYAWDGKALAIIAREGLNFPTDAAELDSETLAVVDAMDHEIDFRNWKGERVGGFGSAGDGLGSFAFIRSMVVDEQGRIYVSDVQKDWIQVFNRNGQLLTAYGGPGILHHPSYLSLEKTGLWVADAFAGRIVELTWK